MKTSRKMMMMAKIKKKSDEKKKPMTVEGSAAKPRLDRPMRMKRADGGPTISDDSKREAARLREDQKIHTRVGAGEVALGALGLGTRRFPAKVAGGLLGVLGARNGAKAVLNSLDADRIERGQATPGREDGDEVKRKRGGKVGK